MLVALDRVGLMSYPGFEADFLVPLKAANKFSLGIWTADRLFEPDPIRRRRYKDQDVRWGSIKPQGLSQYLDFIVGKEDALALAELGEKRDRVALEELFAKIGLGSSMPDLEWIHEHVVKWMAAHRGYPHIRKYPSVLTRDPSILIDSDHSGPNEIVGGRVTRYYGNEKVMEDARELGMSMLLVPEHPGVWELNDRLISPEQVLAQTRDILLSWDGQPMVHDIGYEMGIFESAGLNVESK